MVNNFGAFTVSSSSSSRQLALDSKRETEGEDWIERGEFTATDDKAETGEEKKRPNARITETPLLKARVRQLLFSLVSVLEAILAIVIPTLHEDSGKLVERVSFVGSSAGGSDCGRDGGGSGGDDDKLERRKSLILMTVGAPIGTNCCCSLS